MLAVATTIVFFLFFPLVVNIFGAAVAKVHITVIIYFKMQSRRFSDPR